MNATANEIATELATSAFERYKKAGGNVKLYSTIFDTYLKHLLDKATGNWSPDVAKRRLKNRGIETEDVGLEQIDYSEGSYIMSTKAYGTMHAVALVDGILLDSLQRAPIFLKTEALPDVYEPLGAIRVMIDF